MTLRKNGSLKSISDTKMDQERHNAGTRNEGENLMVRKTQGDLLQKLRQLRQWQQQQQEHLLQNKEKKLGLIKEQEKRLQALQGYQKRILAQNGNLGSLSSINKSRESTGNTPLFHVQTHGSGLQAIPAGRHLSVLQPENFNLTMSMNEVQGSSGLMPPLRIVPPAEGQPALKGLQQGGYNSGVNTMLTNNLDSAGLIPPRSTVLLSPKHFQTAHNPMLLTQKIQLPVSSDEELSQFTESEGSSIGDIDGIRPIEDTASEISLEDDNISDFHALNEAEDDNDLSDIGYGHLGDDFDGDNTLIDGNQDDEQMYVVDKEDLRVNTKPSFDDVPIKPGLGTQTKTFDELLDKQLQAENGKLPEKQDVQPSRVSLKRSFLRKGEGIARFGLQAKKGGSKAIKKQQVLEKMENVDIRNKMNEQKVPVTRKIAVNKLSSSISQDNLGQGSVLQRRKQSSSSESQLSSRVIGPYSSIDVAMETYLEKMIASEGDGVGHGFRKMVPLASVSEDSFQERMKRWDAIDIVEKQELNEFELLEEAAANCSLSSNSSTVLHILGKKKAQAKLDSNNNMPGVVQQWRHARQDSRMFDARNGRIVEERLNAMEHHGDNEAPVVNMEDIEMDSSATNTLTKDNYDDENEDTLKAADIISVQSSLAVSAGFNDSNAWDDHDVLDSSDVSGDLIISLNTSTPEEKGHVRATQRESPHASSTPPTSALVTKLFPQLKPKVNEQPKIDGEQHTKQKQSPTPSTVQVNKQSPSAPVISSNNPHDGVGQVMSNAVRDKLQELEKEIEKFREENSALHRLREEREKVLQDLQRERSLFESYKTEELQRLEKFKGEEEQRLRRDKRVFEQYQKASRALPDKKEREEITALKTKITELQEDMKLRESRWSAAATRYKDRIGNLEKENKEMKEEVKLLEKQNLDLHHKDQHKAREYQQYKAFEKRKLTKSEGEIPPKSVLSRTASQSSSKNEDEHEDFIKENEKLKTPSNSPLVTHQESNKQSNVNGGKHTEKKDVSPAEKDEAKQHSTSTETHQVTKTTTSSAHSETKQSPRSTEVRLKECGSSRSVKKTSSSKNVRFKDNYTTEDDQPELLPKEICHSDGKREVVNADGSRVVTFSNGTRKEISADRFSVIVTFFNGDVKQIMPDEKEVYYYAEAQTTHTTYPDGMQVLQFPSNQIEKHYPDGTKEIIFPDQTVKYLYQSGAEECVFTDGTVERINGDGDRIVEFPNGQRETYTKLFKKREYPDGTVKTVYTDGRQETRYPSGRLRVKDGEGRLLVDTAEQKHTHQQAISL